MPALQPALYEGSNPFFQHLKTLGFRRAVVVTGCRRTALWFWLWCTVDGRRYELATLVIDPRRFDGALHDLAVQLVHAVKRRDDARAAEAQLSLDEVA